MQYVAACADKKLPAPFFQLRHSTQSLVKSLSESSRRRSALYVNCKQESRF